ncbi:hypothetical protein AAZV13_11G062600 [Glycine max]|uniref:uncharacterized protein isoform X2 n=1 Tax=Glycine max TaxID=3847 RepID=UPI0007193939|nr:uncharacterized protein LOC100777228 isoform X2 [Glycine max]XP_028188671.1 late embryogenesis abundant protein 14 isoform X2 [Glycine soja]XP_040862335.1 uncharacterized protein LOC100777228 isoform X2 [Glycine max]XP_040862336.1 uncharacterized protein LOC100777228 isoform X2 [Glycine max]|eukprot:XP_014618975.1 uncharacterized protein LOC100777228 isoform X1 [Glycine max]
MGSTKFLLLVMVFLAVCVGTCRPWGDDVVEDGEEAKHFAAKAVHDVEEETRSWADWAQDKFSNFGAEEDHEKQATQNMKYQAEDAASRATERVKSAASGASDYASQKATDAKEAVSGAKVIKMPTDSINNAKHTMGDTYEDAKQKMNTASDKASSMAHNAKDNTAESMEYGKDIAANAYDQGKQKINIASDTASEKFYDAKDKASDVRHKVKGAMGCGGDKANNDAKNNMGVKMEHGRDKVAETFDQAKREVGEAYVSAKNTMTEEAKAKYEAAKEKASDATGDLGAKMRNTPNV